MLGFAADGEDQVEHLVTAEILYISSASCCYYSRFFSADIVRAFWKTLTHLVVLDKVHEGGPLHLHRLAVSVVERQDEVEEVGLAEVGGRLLLEVSPRQGDSTEDRRDARLRVSINTLTLGSTNTKMRLILIGWQAGNEHNPHIGG